MAEIVKYETTDGLEMELTPRKVIEELVSAKDRPAMTERNVAIIMARCAALRMNPLAGDCHIGVFKGRPTIMPSIDYYQRVASMQEGFDGLEAGVIASFGDADLKKFDGCVVPKGWTIVGGWATAYDKGRNHPVHIEVALDEYDQHNSMWESKPATMIRKVAKAQALRELYPGCFKGTYVAEEMPAEDPRAVTYDVPEPEVPDFGDVSDAEAESVESFIKEYDPRKMAQDES